MAVVYEAQVNNDRQFSFSKIEWEIANYFPATCRESWVIKSPNFIVKHKHTTKWRLSLKGCYIGTHLSVCAFLKMVEKDSQLSDPVRVSWKFLFPCDSKEIFVDGESDFEKKRSVGIEIYDVDILENAIRNSSSETLVVTFLMLVRYKDSDVCDRSEDVGVRSLSQDLRVLYRVDKNHDVEFVVGDVVVKGHKAILCSRSEFLKTEIERENFMVDISGLDFEAVKEVFGYLYTGNLDFILRKPSLHLITCIKYFNITELDGYFQPDEMTLRSVCSVQKGTHTWTIPIYEIIEADILTSPTFTEERSNAHGNVFRFFLYLIGFSQNSDSMSICVESTDETVPKVVCIEISVGDSTGKIFFLQRKKWLNTVTKLEFKKFLSSDDVCDIFSNANEHNLQILCTVRTPTRGSEDLSTVETKTHSSICVETEKHYELLSKQIEHLFETGIYTDFTLKCEGQNFKVHTYLLSARSHVFRRLFRGLKCVKVATFVEVTGIKCIALRALLYYIYSGKLPEHKADDVLQIYIAAQKFFILSLKYACSSILQDNIPLLNSEKVLSLAEEYKDYKLKAALVKFHSKKDAECLQEMAEMDINN